ncbi:hypothetical protein HPB47_006229, partial [Ixodes persulcatus]
VMVGSTSGFTTHNAKGMPQGSVLPPTFSNMAMAEVVFSLDEREGLRFTIYADDMNFWAGGTVQAAQQATLQCALDVT